MGTHCAPLVADLFLHCYERDFMDSLNNDNQVDVLKAVNSTSLYLNDPLNIDNPYFECLVDQIYIHELHLNKANITESCLNSQRQQLNKLQFDALYSVSVRNVRKDVEHCAEC